MPPFSFHCWFPEFLDKGKLRFQLLVSSCLPGWLGLGQLLYVQSDQIHRCAYVCQCQDS